MDILAALKDWEPLLTPLSVFAAVVLGHWWTHRRGKDELELRKRAETYRVFFQASATAHGRHESGRGVGTGEQIAGVYVLADMGVRDPWLREAAKRQLDDWVTNSGVPALHPVTAAVIDARASMDRRAERGRFRR